MLASLLEDFSARKCGHKGISLMRQLEWDKENNSTFFPSYCCYTYTETEIMILYCIHVQYNI